MYFGIGGHPGFQVPLEKRLEFEDLYKYSHHIANRGNGLENTIEDNNSDNIMDSKLNINESKRFLGN